MKGTAWKVFGGTRNFEKPRARSDGYIRAVRVTDTQEQIDTCLKCTERDCIGGRCKQLAGKGPDDVVKSAFGRTVKTYECDGVRYTIRQLAQLAGITEPAVYGRMRCGWSVAEILRGEREIPPGKKLPASELARRLGISANVVRARRHMGWSDEKIARTPVRVYDRSDEAVEG